MKTIKLKCACKAEFEVNRTSEIPKNCAYIKTNSCHKCMEKRNISAFDYVEKYVRFKKPIRKTDAKQTKLF